MGNYAKAAVAAHGLIIKESLTPTDAWDAAISLITSSPQRERKDALEQRF